MPRAGQATRRPCRAAAAIRDAVPTPRVLPFSKGERSSAGRLRERSRFPAPTVPRYDSASARRLLPLPPPMLALPVGPSLPSPGRGTPFALPLLQRWRGREGDPGRPEGGRNAAAGADITRPQAGKVRADAPSDTRRTRFGPTKKTIFAFPQKGEYGGAGGVEGEPLSPHAPRRAGDPPPVPGSSRNSRRCAAVSPAPTVP